jgi:hypothetical protein
LRLRFRTGAELAYLSGIRYFPPKRRRCWDVSEPLNSKWDTATETVPFNGASRSVYRYNIAVSAMIAGAAFVSTAIVITGFVLFAESRDRAGILIVTVLVAFPILLFRAALTRTSIVLDRSGISARAFGINTRRMEWRSVAKITKSRVTNGYIYVDSINVVEGGQKSLLCRFFANLCGDIRIGQDIRDFRELLARINSYAREYEIPLFVWDTEAAAAKVASDRSPGYWRRATAHIPEVRVAQF